MYTNSELEIDLQKNVSAIKMLKFGSHTFSHLVYDMNVIQRSQLFSSCAEDDFSGCLDHFYCYVPIRAYILFAFTVPMLRHVRWC